MMDAGFMHEKSTHTPCVAKLYNLLNLHRASHSRLFPEVTGLLLLQILFFFYRYGHHRNLHSFPTRRSSDLNWRQIWRTALLTVTVAGGDRSPVLRSRSRQATMSAKPSRLPAKRILLAEDDDSMRGFLERALRSEEHTSELQSLRHLVCRLLL